MPPPPNRAAFTVLEMIVVLSVVLVLLVLSMAGLSNLRSKATSASCLGQLRQIGAAIHLYLGEHRGHFFEQGAPGTLNNWIKQIDPYAPSERSLYKCPADKTPTRIERTYRFNRTPGASGAANTASLYGKRYQQVLSPSSTIMLFCIAYNGPASMPLFKVDTDSWSIALDRLMEYAHEYPRLHDPGGVNLLFADGHAAAMRYPIEDRYYYWDRP